MLVKICGVTTPADAAMIAAAGADWIGLNFHPPSPRFLREECVPEVIRAIGGRATSVGLFVNRPVAEVVRLAQRLGLDLVQLHGDEPPEDVATLTREGVRIVRAFRLGDRESIDRMARYLDRCGELEAQVEAVLTDAYVAGLPGGTGRTIECELLSDLPLLDRWILAGGLSPENVAARLSVARPWMVDVAGGVESEPGRKDPVKVEAFLRAVRNAL